jgi:hypothetical protein
MHIGTVVWVVTSMASLLLATVAVIVANLSIMAMIDEMNVHLPSGRKISVLGFWPGKLAYIFSAYHDVCPAGTANRRAIRRLGVAFAAFIVFALVFFGLALVA